MISFRKQKLTAIFIQSTVRMIKVRNSYLQYRKSVIQMQADIRMILQKRSFKLLCSAAVVAQLGTVCYIR